MRTILGLFESPSEAKSTIDDLRKIGAGTEDISVLTPDPGQSLGGDIPLAPVDIPGFGRIGAFGAMMSYLDPKKATHRPEEIISALVSMGVPEIDAARYSEGLHRGYTLETVKVADEKADQALAIMNQHITAERTTASKVGKARTQGERIEGESEQMLPVIVEELRVGKREVGAGGVRVTTTTKETPVQETVALREEHVSVERRAVDRAVEAPSEGFKDRTVEVVATAEEPVVEKRARVVEEVVIHKGVEHHKETVQDTVRNTEVEVQPIASEFDPSKYREHFVSTYGEKAPYGFDAYEHAYKFGTQIRQDKRFAGAEEWTGVEPSARTAWEEKNPGTWERFKDAVRHAWEKAKGH